MKELSNNAYSNKSHYKLLLSEMKSKKSRNHVHSIGLSLAFENSGRKEKKTRY